MRKYFLRTNKRLETECGGQPSQLHRLSARTGVAILAAIGAPSSLAVNLALASGMTLVGFLREKHCNIYSSPQRFTDTAEHARASTPQA
jgi:FdhD protein